MSCGDGRVRCRRSVHSGGRLDAAISRLRCLDAGAVSFKHLPRSNSMRRHDAPRELMNDRPLVGIGPGRGARVAIRRRRQERLLLVLPRLSDDAAREIADVRADADGKLTRRWAATNAAAAAAAAAAAEPLQCEMPGFE